MKSGVSDTPEFAVEIILFSTAARDVLG